MNLVEGVRTGQEMAEKVHGFGPPPGVSDGESGDYFKQVWLK